MAKIVAEVIQNLYNLVFVHVQSTKFIIVYVNIIHFSNDMYKYKWHELY